jgi:hypothetical protein
MFKAIINSNTYVSILETRHAEELFNLIDEIERVSESGLHSLPTQLKFNIQKCLLNSL